MANLSLEALLEELHHRPDWLMVPGLMGFACPWCSIPSQG